MTDPVLRVTAEGLYCARGDFYVDPWKGVDRAVITHGHADHARWGSKHYIATEGSAPILHQRLRGLELRTHRYNQVFELGDARVSFHPAGHVLGSAQVRVEVDGEVWVVSGDYKRAADPTCTAFEVVECDTFITEATFALPVYQWQPGETVAREILSWWDGNARRGRASVLLCYALGKAQRVLGELARLTDRSVFVHGAIASIVDLYREAGIPMLPTEKVQEKRSFAGELILAPPSAAGSTWLRRFGDYELGFASGWMRLRGSRRRRGYDRGFVLSDHADWPALVETVRATGAQRVLATHGYTDAIVRFLRESGIDANALETAYEGESDDG
ncbi:MAG: ligase-associated DNA damage response exonuclease [Myxococcota bacterium]